MLNDKLKDYNSVINRIQLQNPQKVSKEVETHLNEPIRHAKLLSVSKLMDPYDPYSDTKRSFKPVYKKREFSKVSNILPKIS